ncbi:MAG: hypothetical protein LBS25_07555 [Candidatus Symbiothrix sp.]|jgi:hypothetical protein|nr:hypothetical protein [Candidatus Symbiothrix sp.]
MKKLTWISIFWMMAVFGFGQKFVWQAEVNSFFDNTEFDGSTVQTPQTMAGLHVAPEVGFSWQNRHRIFVGCNAMHEYGSLRTVDYLDPVAYYEYDGKPFRFYMGAVPRKMLLEKYPRMFFQDSITFYRPVINGFFWEYAKPDGFLNIWLDWTGRKSFDRHEAFFMGWSGRYGYSIFYAQHFGYMFHYAGVDNPAIRDPVHDNGLVLTSLGIDLSQKTGFEKADFNIGWSVGLDRDRGEHAWHTPMGLLSELRIEYRGLGLFNTYYKGRGQQFFYGAYGNRLYWGDPVYRADEYNRADFYIQFLKTQEVEVKFVCSLHFVENHLFNEQLLQASVELSKLKATKKTPAYRYLWSNWF